MKRSVYFLFVAVTMLFSNCNKYDDEISDLEDRVDNLENVSISDLKQELQRTTDSMATLAAKLDALEDRYSSVGTDLSRQLDSLRSDLEKAQSDFTLACNAAIAAAIEANNEVLEGAIADSLNVARREWQTAIGEITADINERLASFEKHFVDRLQSLTYIPTHSDGKATMYYFMQDVPSRAELTFFVTPKSAVGSLGSEHITVRAVHTSLTRSVSLVELPVTNFERDTVNGTITVRVSGDPLSESFFHGESAASLFLEIQDGNSECVSDAVELELSGVVTDPADVVKGDLAFKNGTFLRGNAFTTLLTTDEQVAVKDSVAGIVFWTTKDTDLTDVNRQTPAKLTDDAIMKADFPHCTHGLIVSLKNVSASMKWQSSYEFVYDNFQNTDHFTATNKADYVSVGVTTGSMNKVLGYQNTKVLQAYNAYCRATDGKSDYVVQPVEALTEFTTANPAPANSTGWYIPSPKEVHMLCYKDVDNIGNVYGTDKLETKTAMNALLEKLGGDQFDTYTYYCWSSAEYSRYARYAWGVFFNEAFLSSTYKDNDGHVRAVCAF